MSTTVQKTEKKERKQLSDITGVLISPARLRRFLDEFGINQKVQRDMDKMKVEIMKIKKEGGPKHPDSVEPLKRVGATKEQISKHEEMKVKYASELKVYNAYISEKYKRVKSVYVLLKNLNKVVDLMLKKKRNPVQEEELRSLRMAIVNNTIKSKSEKFELLKFSDMLGSTNMEDVESIKTLLVSLKQSNPETEFFLSKDELSKSRIRFNDSSAVALATAIELALEEMIKHGMEDTLKSHKKTLKPDNCISEGLEDCDWYMFVRNLPHLTAVLDRQKRKNEYNSKKDDEKFKMMQKAKTQSKKEGKTFLKPKFTYPSFQDMEVEFKFATKEVVQSKDLDKDGKPIEKVVYKWIGIDCDEVDESDVQNITFCSYVQHLCKKVIEEKVDSKESQYFDIKISSNIRKFLSDLIVDFVSKVLPLIKLLISAMKVKTVDEDVIKTVLRLMVTDKYHNSTGEVEFKPEHEVLFTLIDKKVELCKEHQGTDTKEVELDA